MEWTCMKCGAVLRAVGNIAPEHTCPMSAETRGSARGQLAVLVGAAAGLYVWWKTRHGEMAIVAAIAAGAIASTKTGSKLIGWALLLGLGWLLLRGL